MVKLTREILDFQVSNLLQITANLKLGEHKILSDTLLDPAAAELSQRISSVERSPVQKPVDIRRNQRTPGLPGVFGGYSFRKTSRRLGGTKELLELCRNPTFDG